MKKEEFVFNTQWVAQVILAAIAIVLSAFLGLDGTVIATIGGIYIVCFALFVPVGFGFGGEEITQRFIFYGKKHAVSDIFRVDERVGSFRLYPRGYYYSISFSGQRACSIKIPKNAKTSEQMKKYASKKNVA